MTSPSASELGKVAASDWIIDDALLHDRPRIVRLMNVPSATDLISLVSEAAKDAAHGARIHTTLIRSEDQPEYFRVEAKIPISEPLFDQLFNGRSGYRAQYYLSAAQGAAFNRMIVDALAPAALDACRCGPFANVRNAIARSLAGRHSKIWVIGDGAAFLDSPAALKPARWKAYWQAEATALGLRLPCPPPPQLDLKGTFVNFDSDEERVSEEKKDRDEEIFKKGWS